jgi:hypothetical protein
VSPTLVVGFSIVAIVLLVRSPGNSAWSIVAVGQLVALLCLPLIWFGARLEDVSIDETFLYIERGENEEKILLEDISEVRQANWIKPHPIKIKLREGTHRRASIMFIPAAQGVGGVRMHPIVEELNRLKSSRSL